MIVKSIGCKTPRFRQLVWYLSRDGTERAYDLHHHLLSERPEAVASEFLANAELIAARHRGNLLYHEILSIDTRACGQGPEIKDALKRLALAYVAKRCPDCLAYGVLHADHAEHLHYHLMISANGRGETRRHRLSRGEFATVKRELEALALEHFPELKQDVVINRQAEKVTETRSEDGDAAALRVKKKKSAERSASDPGVRDQMADWLKALMDQADDQASLEAMLWAEGWIFYTRGKHCGVKEATPEAGKKPKTYRFATLGIAEAYEAFLTRTAEPMAEIETEELAEAQEAAPDFLEEMEALRAERRKPKQTLKQTHSLSRLIRRVRVSVKRLIRRKLRQALGRNISW